MNMSPEIQRQVGRVVASLVASDARRATKYMSEKLVVRATRPRFKRSNDARGSQIVLTIGRPNYNEQKFVKWCCKAKEPFPIKSIIHTFAKKRA